MSLKRCVLFVRRFGMHSSFASFAFLMVLLSALTGCDQMPEFVFILEFPQTVVLTTTASPLRVHIGDKVVLSAQRVTKGIWKRIPSKLLTPEQCWMAAIPPERESEVADNLHWVVNQSDSAKYNTDFRPDHTRAVTMSAAGMFSFSASTSIWCEPGRTITAPPLRVEVVPE